MNVLITGGAGFIGSNFIHFALQQHDDWRLWNLDKLTYAGNLANLSELQANPRYTFIHGDIADQDAVEKIMSHGIDLIINFAAESHVDRSINSSREFLVTGVLGVQTLLEAAKKHAVKLFYQISTDEVYGDLPPGNFAKESDSLSPSSPYSAAKAAGDLLVLSYARTFDLPAIISRCTNNYGPYQYPEKMLPLFITNILRGKTIPVYGDGQQIRDWLHVSDHCRAIDLLVARGQRGAVYNIGVNHQPEHTNLEIADLLLQELGAEPTVIKHVTDRLGHDRRYAVDVQRIQSLGWKPVVPFAPGIRQTIQWYVQHPDWWKPLINH